MHSSDPTASTPSDLALFLKTLAEEGRAVVSPQPLATESDEALSALNQLDELARVELALDAPQFSANAALWAARLFYHLCQFTVCREIGEDQIAAACRIPCPEPRGPKVDWSVDLTVRHLPKLFDLARHLSNADPLLQQMKQIASAWPLSSVGIAGLENLRLDSFVFYPALRRLYTDRIIAAGDATRLGDPRVADFLRADLGLHHELAPAIASKLSETTHDTH
jgi:MoxR-vWA-beta-propeller ternary system domain bpX4